tara:strand:- start:191 stop:730 length:540 start_codon:yes stop_codon:yes gene_type:complete
MIKINIGCGWRNFGKDWIHIDGGDYPHLDSKGVTELDYNNNSVDLIYASHLLEYFDRDEAMDILKEWIRVLKPNGILRLAVPNFEAMVHLYTEKHIPLEKFLGPLYGKMPMGSETIYHKTTYDYYSLKSVVEELGMRDYKWYDWEQTEHSKFDDHSQAYIPHMDKENGTLISLNVECTK